MPRNITPTVIGQIYGDEVVPASATQPLRTQSTPQIADPLLTSFINADTNANRDILGNTAAEQPTLSHCGQYHTLIWTGTKSAASDVNYIIEARSTDINSGGPLAGGWFQVATGTITGAANSWFRVVITTTEGLYWDQYRIRVQVASGTNLITSKITGVRR